MVKLLGTEDTRKLIVDILVVRRDFAKKKPEAVELLLSTYFRVLKGFRDDPTLLLQEVRAETGLPEEAAKTMLGGVRWVTLTENCEQWFGISAPGVAGLDGLVDAIQSTARILVSAGDFASSPLPGDDPYRLLQSAFLEQLFTKGLTGFTSGGKDADAQNAQGSLEARFPGLSDEQWDRLQEVAALKMQPIAFPSGASELDFLAKREVDEAVRRLEHYPRFRVEIRGHTSDQGDVEANRALSRDRAEAVARYLQVVYNVDPSRLRTRGLGGAKPLPRGPGESDRAWRYRLPRVELVLVREEY